MCHSGKPEEQKFLKGTKLEEQLAALPDPDEPLRHCDGTKGLSRESCTPSCACDFGGGLTPQTQLKLLPWNPVKAN